MLRHQLPPRQALLQPPPLPRSTCVHFLPRRQRRAPEPSRKPPHQAAMRDAQPLLLRDRVEQHHGALQRAQGTSWQLSKLLQRGANIVHALHGHSMSQFEVAKLAL